MAVGSDVRVDVRVNLGGLSPDDVRVEVVAGVRNGDGGSRPAASWRASTRDEPAARSATSRSVPTASSGRLACAARVVPLRPDGAGPEPDFLIAWADD